MATELLGPFVLTDEELDDRLTRFESTDNDEIEGITGFELIEIISHLLHTNSLSKHSKGYSVIALYYTTCGLITSDGRVVDDPNDPDGLASLAEEGKFKCGPNFETF